MDIEIGSLSKAFSVMGGFIAAKQPLVDAYLMSARQRLFSIALTIPVRAAQSLPGRPAPPTSMLGPVLVLLLLVLARETLAVALRLCVDTDWSSPTVLIWLYIVVRMQDTAALLEAVTMLGESEHKVEKLWANLDYLNNGFRELGFDIGQSETPIIPVMLGDEDLVSR